MPQFTIMIKRDFRSKEEAREIAGDLIAQVCPEKPKVTVRYSVKDETGKSICWGIQPAAGDFGIISCNFEADPLFKNLL